MPRSLIYFSILVASLLYTHALNEPACCSNDPCCDEQCIEYDECDCATSGGGTGSGSINFEESLLGGSSGDGYRYLKLKFNHSEPSATMYTVQGLNLHSAAGILLSNVDGDFTIEETVTLTVIDEQSRAGVYEVSDGTYQGISNTDGGRETYELELLDAQLQPAIDIDPIYIKFKFLENDSYVLLDYATGKPLKEVDERGKEFDLTGLDIVRQSGVIRQVAFEGGLADFYTIDVDHEFEIRLYREGNYSFNPVSGLYELNSGIDPVTGAYKRINIQNPAYDLVDVDETYITRYWDDRITQWQFQYYPNNDLWEARIGEVISGSFNLIRSEEASEVLNQNETIKTYVKKVYDDQGHLLSHFVRVSEIENGQFQITSKVEDPDSANLATSYTYNAVGLQKSRVDPDGSWTAYEYDSEERIALQVESWEDTAYDGNVPLSTLAATAKATSRSYTPVDSNDDGSIQTDAPRVQTVKIEGIISEIVWNAYYRDSSGLYYEITERATQQNAVYGDASNLRSEKIYYASAEYGETATRAGRLKSERSEDGSLVVYDYALEISGNFVVTATATHLDDPEGIPFKATRTKKTYDANANLIKDEMFVFDGTAYQSIYYMTHTYDADRNLIESRRFDGIAGGRIVFSASFEHGKAVSETDETGVVKNTSYDVLDRKELETILGDVASGVGDITRFYQYSTAATGCGCSASQVLIMDASGTLTMTEINETDRVKRPSRDVDVNGMETTYEYTNGGRVTTVTNPDLSTRVVTNYLDGRVKSITGTGVVSEYYTYGVNTDGSTWTRIDIATATSPRYRITTFDLAGRSLKEESPAFDGSIYTMSYEYDAGGRLASQSAPGSADTLYIYDSAGDLFRSGLDIDNNGQLDLASTDRITDNFQAYLLEAGSWFSHSVAKVYPTSGSGAEVTLSENKRRLSGFSGSLASEVITSDIHQNETVETIEIDQAAKTVTQKVNRPGSTIDQVSLSINGYLKEQNSSTVSAATLYTYDGLGWRISVKEPRHAQATTFDYYTNTRQIFNQTDGAGNTTSFTYYANGENGAGRMASVTDPLSQKIYFSYDLLGRQTRSWGQTDYPQEYGYNLYGELGTLTTWQDTAIDFSTATWPSPSGGDTTTWIYQASTGLLTRKEYADTNGTDYGYDSANRLTLRTWARNGGLDTTYSYTSTTGELLSIDYEDAATADIAYTYDRLGRQVTVTDATGTRSFAYDTATLQLTAESLDNTFYNGYKLARNYEVGTEIHGLAGRSKGYSLQDSTSIEVSMSNYSYDSSSRLASISDGTDTFTYSYMTSSNLLANLSAPSHIVGYSYETNRDLMTIVDNQLSGNGVSKYVYTYDALGRRVSREQSGSAFTAANTDTFSYNSRSEVTGSTNDILTSSKYAPAYSFDQIGNRLTATGGVLDTTSVSYTSNSLNQYASLSAPSMVNPTHDLDGNLTSDGSLWTYVWNNENRLSSATDGTTTLTFTYDYLGRLVKKDDGSTVELYIYDGWNRIASFDVQPSTFTLQTSYTWGLDLSGSMQGAGGVGGLLKEGSLYPLYDANGNITQKLDGSGSMVMNVDYDPFGNIISGSLVGEYGFSTKPFVDGPDWYYYGFRYYDPVTGRWPSRDPIEELGGVGLYGFVFNTPLDFIDRLGREPISGSAGPSHDSRLGNFNPDLTEQQSKSNCTGTALGSEDSIEPTPDELLDRGCVEEGDGGCSGDTPNLVIFYIYSSPNQTGRYQADTAHVIGQTCGTDTFQQQAGDGGPVFDGIQNPSVAADAYYENLLESGTASDNAEDAIQNGDRASINFCCPCEVE